MRKKPRYNISNKKNIFTWTTEIHDMMKPADFSEYVRMLHESGDIRNVLADNIPKENVK